MYIYATTPEDVVVVVDFDVNVDVVDDDVEDDDNNNEERICNI